MNQLVQILSKHLSTKKPHLLLDIGKEFLERVDGKRELVAEGVY